MISAFLRREIIEPLYSLKNGSPKLKHWKELEKTQYLSEGELFQKQWDRLNNLLKYVYYNNRFYRKRFDNLALKPSGIRTPADIKKLPILTKKEIRENMDVLISDDYDKKKLLKFKTGGSTGKPLEIYISEECSEMRNACARRHDRWSGWEMGEPVGAVWGNPVLPRGVKEMLKNWLLTPTIYLDTMCIDEKSVREFAEKWQKVNPTLLFGHAHSIFLLAQYVQDLKIDSIRPKGIISSSMVLLPLERMKIEDVFGVKVSDRYGCEEVGLIGSECERHEGLHLNIDHLFVEFIKPDGTDSKASEPGRIILTDLINYAMPFIRYEIEDIGVPSDRKCSCGRGLPMIEKVIGRVADFLIRKDGSRVAGVSLIENTLTKITGIEQMQIVQEEISLIKLNIVPGKSFSMCSEEKLEKYFKQLFGFGTQVKIELVNEIKPEKSGKYRFSICKVDSL